jgi:hypothetical protein
VEIAAGEMHRCVLGAMTHGRVTNTVVQGSAEKKLSRCCQELPGAAAAR